MWHFSNNEWTTSFNNTKIIITQSTPQQLPLLTISRFESPGAHVILDTEQHKSITQLSAIFKYLQQQQCNRGTVINVRGGGLALDIGGFVASVFLRGVKCNYIPTTLLSMVDASVGGKTGINFGGKNMVGTIKQPQTVYINLEYLKCLDRRELMNGMAEVIKIAFVYDPKFFKWLQRLKKDRLMDRENILHIVKESIMLKMKVVERDVDQIHERKWLNFGHTIGHAVEYMMEPELKHGECVSIGMVLENKLAIELGLLEDQNNSVELKQLLEKFQLPVELPLGLNPERCLDLMMKDKKQKSSDGVNFTLVKRIGQPCIFTTQISIQFLKRIVFNEPISIMQQKNINYESPMNQNMFPSSKSLSIRYLFACALKVLTGFKPLKVENCLDSDDTRALIGCLKKLGFTILVSGSCIQIARFHLNKEASFSVRNSGLTARFILPLCVILNGNYQILCDQRMEQRPNKEIFALMESFGARIEFMKAPHCFPVKISSSKISIPKEVTIDGKQSSQFASSILLLSFLGKMPKIKIAGARGELVSESFIKMTLKVLEQFGVKIDFNPGQNTFVCNKIQSTNLQQRPTKNVFVVEPDYASLSYPYLYRLINDSSLPNIPTQQSLQGDILFYKYIQKLQNTSQNSHTLNFNNCTDTFMTMLVYVICRKKKDFQLKITNIANQRVKQSNRINVMIENLRKVADIQQNQDGVTVRGGIEASKIPKGGEIVFESFDDHRVAMSMTVLASYLSKSFPDTKFIITTPNCVNKTFPNFWRWFSSQNTTIKSFPSKKLSLIKQKTPQSYYLIGMRGCGKTTYSRALSSELGFRFMDMDDLCTDSINSKYKCRTIAELVEKHGWKKFREVETQVLKKVVKESDMVVATGGGIVEEQINRHILEREECLYVEKMFEDLNIDESETRPSLGGDLRAVFERREEHYLSLAKTIVTLNENDAQTNTDFFINQFKRKYINKASLEGFVVCLNDFEQAAALAEYQGVEWRLDQILNHHSLKDIRFKLAQSYLASPLNTILTLRTKDQIGSCDQKLYSFLHKQIRKIPAEFIDSEISNISSNQYIRNPLWSYHGSQRRWLEEMRYREGIKKVILTPNNNYKLLEQEYKNRFDLFWTMGIENRPTRLDSKVKMVVARGLKDNKSGIMTKKEFLNLFSLLKRVVKR